MQIEVNQGFQEKNMTINLPETTLVFTPPVGGSYYLARVAVSGKQAVVCFPKFFTIGIGFQIEDDWNTNLPYTCTAEEIYRHIDHNANAAGDEPAEDDCIAAIRLLQTFAGQVMNAVQS